MLKRLIFFIILLGSISFAQNGIGYGPHNNKYQIAFIPIADPGGTVSEFVLGDSLTASLDHKSPDPDDPWNAAIGDTIFIEFDNKSDLWNDSTLYYRISTAEFSAQYYELKARTYGTIRIEEISPGVYKGIKGYTPYSKSSAYFLLLRLAEIPTGVRLQ